MSELMLTARRPMWSTIQPLTGAMKSGGSDAAASTSPASVAEPSRSMTSQGIAMVTIALPRPEHRLAACSSRMGI